jgi:hypothetical protein
MRMRSTAPRSFPVNASQLAGLLVLACLAKPGAWAQNSQLQERLAEIKASAALNKQALAQYTWEEQQTISIKGDVKTQKRFLVRFGPDGKPQKTEINPQDQSSGGRKHGLKQRVVKKKKAEYEDYAKQMAALAQDYARPDPERLQQLFQQGNIMFGPAGTPRALKVVIHDYLKQGDSVTLVFSEAQKALESIAVSSYLENPKDGMTLSAQFTKEPEGPNHVSSMLVNGVSKQLTIAMQNSKYQRM